MNTFSLGSITHHEHGSVTVSSPRAAGRIFVIAMRPLSFLVSTALLVAAGPFTEFTATLIGIVFTLCAVSTHRVWRNTTWGDTVITDGIVMIRQKRLFVDERIFQLQTQDIVDVGRVRRHGRLPLGWYHQVVVTTTGGTVLATGPISKQTAVGAETAIRSAVLAAHATHHTPARPAVRF